MGKVRRLRQKYHATLKSEPTQNQDSAVKENHPNLPVTLPSDNLFAGLDIDIASLKTQLADDARSVKSHKSTTKTQSAKKDKLKLRREQFMRKLDVLGRAKKEQKAAKKRRKTPIVGDVNPLRDALPSLESLLKNRTQVKYTEEPKKSRGIAKAKKRKKELVQGVKTFKAVMNSGTFKKNPLEAITKHVQTVVAQAKQKN